MATSWEWFILYKSFALLIKKSLFLETVKKSKGPPWCIRIVWHKWNQQPVTFYKSKLLKFLTNVLLISLSLNFSLIPVQCTMHNLADFFLRANIYSKISLEAFRGLNFGWITVLDVWTWSYNRQLLVKILSSLAQRDWCVLSFSGIIY